MRFRSVIGLVFFMITKLIELFTGLSRFVNADLAMGRWIEFTHYFVQYWRNRGGVHQIRHRCILPKLLTFCCCFDAGQCARDQIV